MLILVANTTLPPINQNLVIVNCISICVVITIFIIDRYINHRYKIIEYKQNWYLNVIVKPKLIDIQKFYDLSFKSLNDSITQIQQLPPASNIIILQETKVAAISTFQKHKSNFDLSFIMLIESYDHNLSIELQNCINGIDDIITNAIGAIDYTQLDLNIIHKNIILNKTKFFQTLYSVVNKKCNQKTGKWWYFNYKLVKVK